MAGASTIAVVVWALPPAYTLPFAVFAALLWGLGAYLLLDRRIRARQSPPRADKDTDTRIHRRLESMQTSIWGRKKQLIKVREQLARLERSQDRLAKQIAKSKPVVGPKAPAEDPRTAESVRELTEAIERQAGEIGRAAVEQAEIRALVESVGRLQSMELLRRDSGADLVPFERELAAVRSSPLFDADWYTRRTGVDGDPAFHYLTHGRLNGIDPHPMFAEHWYGERHPESWLRHRSGLGHFLDQAPGVSTHPAFDLAWYRDTHLADATDVDPVFHYLTEGAELGLSPSPLFDPAWYAAEHADRLDEGADPFLHYLTEGIGLGLRPHPAVDVEALAVGGLANEDAFARVAEDFRDIDPAAVALPEAPEEADWKRYNVLSRKFTEPDTFALYRIIGNDLPPRHTVEQTMRNLRFILDHEPEFEGCHKTWILNRIIDRGTEQDIIELLESRGAAYLRIPFAIDEFAAIGWNFRGLSDNASFTASLLDKLAPTTQNRIQEHVYHYKNLYVMHNNGARNFALADGERTAKWVLPWDGNCFLTAEAWEEILRSVRRESHRRYFIVPMTRLAEENEVLLGDDPPMRSDDEPQIIFRNDAQSRFNPDYRYGHRPKVELFKRLGIPGPWDRFPVFPWDPEQTVDMAEQNAWGRTAQVYRLFSGNAELETDASSRGKSRSAGIRTLIDRLDAKVLAGRYRPEQLFALDEDVLDEQRESFTSGDPFTTKLVAEITVTADLALTKPCPSVADKTTLPPSGDRLDYWNAAPYWWPNPDTPDGLPYVRRDGERALGTHLGEPGSEQYDRTALQEMFDRTFACALAGSFTGRADYFEKAADLVRTWFLDESTRMNPHLEYAQVRRGHNGDQGVKSGLIETKDLYYLLDAIRLTERAGALSAVEGEGLRQWFTEFRTWLTESRQGREEKDELHNHGLWYDIQVAAIEAFTGDMLGLSATLRRGIERIGHQFDPADGSQPAELKRTLTQHYSAYALSAALILADLAERVGLDFLGYEHPRGSSLDAGVRWALDSVGKPWPYPQIEPFDDHRFEVIGHWYRGHRPGAMDWSWLRPVGEIPSVFSVHNGIRPFWQVGGAAVWRSHLAGDPSNASAPVAPVVEAIPEPAVPRIAGPDFLHVIATRHGIGVFDEDWYAYRQELLGNLTAPSLAAQTCQDFVWLVFVDAAMPPASRSNLERVLKDHPTARIVEVELKIDFVSTLARLAQAEAADRGLSHVLTTRIDDDDVIHRDLVRRLQNRARAFLNSDTGGRAAITPTIGYRWVPSLRRGHRSYKASPSMGISSVEPVGEVQTVYKQSHNQILRVYGEEGSAVHYIEGAEPMWMYAITNIADQQGPDGDRRIEVIGHDKAQWLDDEVLEQFGVRPEGARLLTELAEPDPVESTKMLTLRGQDVEKRIQELRKKLRRLGDAEPAADEIAAQIDKLHQERREMHSNLVVWNR